MSASKHCWRADAGEYLTVFGWSAAMMGASCAVAFPNRHLNEQAMLDWAKKKGINLRRVKAIFRPGLGTYLPAM